MWRFLTSPLHSLHLLQRPSQCRVLFITNFSSQDFSNIFLDCTVYTMARPVSRVLFWIQGYYRPRPWATAAASPGVPAVPQPAVLQPASARNPFWCQSRQVQEAKHGAVPRIMSRAGSPGARAGATSVGLWHRPGSRVQLLHQWNSDLARNSRHSSSPIRRRRIRRVEPSGPGQR